MKAGINPKATSRVMTTTQTRKSGRLLSGPVRPQASAERRRIGPRRGLCAILGVGLLVACHPVDVPPPVDPTEPPRLFDGSHALLGETVPLPRGPWELAVSNSIKTADPRAAEQYYTVLVSRANGVIDRAVITWVQARKDAGNTYWSGFQGCLTEGRDPTVHRAEVRSNIGWTELARAPALDCWHVRALNLGTEGRVHPIVADLDAHASATGDYLPLTMLGARFARARTGHQRAYVEYLFNPDLLYPGKGPWRAADWTREAVAADAGKKAVVDTLTEWARDWHDRVHRDPDA